jgi:hypothetical protein
MASYLLGLCDLPEVSMLGIKFEIKVAAEGCWVGYTDQNGDWHDATRSPCCSFNEALTLKEHFQQAQDNIDRSPAA